MTDNFHYFGPPVLMAPRLINRSFPYRVNNNRVDNSKVDNIDNNRVDRVDNNRRERERFPRQMRPPRRSDRNPSSAFSAR